MTVYPYEPSSDPDSKSGLTKPGRVLFWLSCGIVGLLSLVYVALLLSSTLEYFNLRDEGLPALLHVLAVLGVYTLIIGCLLIPQFVSVFCRSLRAAKCTYWIARIGMWIALLAVPIYPIFEYAVDISPKGAEINGIIGFSMLAGLFYLNSRLHQTWIIALQSALSAAN